MQFSSLNMHLISQVCFLVGGIRSLPIFRLAFPNLFFNVGTPNGVHLFDHLLWPLFQSSSLLDIHTLVYKSVRTLFNKHQQTSDNICSFKHVVALFTLINLDSNLHSKRNVITVSPLTGSKRSTYGIGGALLTNEPGCFIVSRPLLLWRTKKIFQQSPALLKLWRAPTNKN